MKSHNSSPMYSLKDIIEQDAFTPWREDYLNGYNGVIVVTDLVTVY